ncbi:iron-siderophore ABC transporter substrate-binding protein [Amorphus sp. 3PC139-8]|uniref:iron-siderophore ABC transporter substrate-binding protein n=1 Tax=Amorphus sp. 3PC139-8 TaxID=2735676 RepID=UPI00345C641D
MAPVRPALSRRAFVLAGAASAASAIAAPLPVRASEGPRLVSLDYGLANTAMALGVTPVGVAAAAGWSKWVVEPPLPANVADLGMDRLINLERLAALKPNLILATPYVASLRSRLEDIAPVLSLTIYAPDGEPLERAYAATRTLGDRLDRRADADAYLAKADAEFADWRTRIAKARPGPVVLINFMDARHARVYGAHALFQNALDRIGLKNGWTGPTNFWGFQTIGLEQLAQAEPGSTIVAIEPIPPDVEPTLAESPLWNRLPAVAAGRYAELPGALAYGAVPSALRFARLITDLTTAAHG